MDNQKIKSLLGKKEFVERIISVKTPEEVQAEFKNEGAEISLEEVGVLGSLINKSLEKGGKPLSEEDLTEVAGGGPFCSEARWPHEDLFVVLTGVIVSPVVYPLILAAGAAAGAGAAGVTWAAVNKKKKKQAGSN